MYRVTKPGGVVVWVVGDATINGSETGTSFRQALYFMGLGFNLHDTMIYAKKNFIPQLAKRYEPMFEFMFVFSKGYPKTFNPILEPCKTSGMTKNFARAGYPRGVGASGSQRRRDEDVTVKENKVHGNIFYYASGSNKTGHPAPFPERLAIDHVLTWSNPGDIVYDPFGGSGTTPKVAEMLGRAWIVSEISGEYCGMIRKRLGIRTEGIEDLL